MEAGRVWALPAHRECVDHVEFETLDWVDWFNNRRLLEPIGNIPRIGFEELHYGNQQTPALVAGLT